MSLLSHFKRTPAELQDTGFRECRSWYGFAIHIRDLSDESGLALCGYKPLDDFSSPLTVERYLGTLRNQHESSFYCNSCRMEFSQKVPVLA